MYENIDYAKTKKTFERTRKVLAKVARDNGINPATARGWVFGRLNPKNPDEGQHAKIAKMFEKEGCLVFRRTRKKSA